MSDRPLKARVIMAMEEINDESVFSPDQITRLKNMLSLLLWGLEDELARRPAPSSKDRGDV